MNNEQEQNHRLERLRKALQGAVPPAVHTEPRRDFWPQLLQRIEEPSPRISFHLAWFDWTLLGIAGATLLFFPALIPALLYHL